MRERKRRRKTSRSIIFPRVISRIRDHSYFFFSRFTLLKSRVFVVDGDRTSERPLLVLALLYVLALLFVLVPLGAADPRLRLPVLPFRFRSRGRRKWVRYWWKGDGGGDRVRGVGGGRATHVKRTAHDRIGRAVRLLDGHRGRLITRFRLALLRNRRGTPQGRPSTLTVTARVFG